MILQPPLEALEKGKCIGTASRKSRDDSTVEQSADFHGVRRHNRVPKRDLTVAAAGDGEPIPDFARLAAAEEARTVEDRHWFHAHPELAGREGETRAAVLKKLREIPGSDPERETLRAALSGIGLL